MKKFLVSFAFVAICAVAQAQIVGSRSSAYVVTETKTSPKGWNEFNIQYNPTKLVPDNGDSFSMSGISLEWNKVRSLLSTSPLYLQYGFGIQYNWGSEDDTDYDGGYKEGYEYNIKMLGVKVPVNVLYHYDIPNSQFAIEPHAGLNFRIHAYGNAEAKSVSWNGSTKSHDYDVFSSDDMEEPWNRFQIGYNLGVNAVYEKLVFGITYTGDFSELGKDLNMSVWNIKFGVRF